MRLDDFGVDEVAGKEADDVEGVVGEALAVILVAEVEGALHALPVGVLRCFGVEGAGCEALEDEDACVVAENALGGNAVGNLVALPFD